MKKSLHFILCMTFFVMVKCYNSVKKQNDGLPSRKEKQDERERVFDVIEQALSMAGYQVLYGENGEVIIRNSMLEEDMAVQISELLDQGKGSTNE